ncbi:MAG: hypothetical protein UV38_C0003G0085 [candidate division TM6 bacterium GW2011_GWE2_42_60]|nr:MAG: hypothetical protein UV38_C0003G0085 [candidate division TM6 bacterium GW2011_GWE2_42_60]HBY05435.1 hypothetical protein [Candidatus Dependentiae bacterium]
MKQYLKLALLGLIVAGINQTMWGERLKVTSPYPEEQAFIDYNSIFSPGDMDGFWEGTFGPRYTIYDIAARNDTSTAVVALLEKRYQEVKNYTNLSTHLLPFVPGYNDFLINLNGLRWGNSYGVGSIFQEKTYGGNPLAIAASHGRLEVVKAIVEWIKSKLQALNALDKLPLYLNAPALNFGVGPTKGHLILGTPLIFALLNKHFDVARYFIDQGVKPEGAPVLQGPLSPKGDSKMAFIVPLDQDGRTVLDPETINVEKLILDAQLKLDPKLEISSKKAETNRLQREEQEKIHREKEHQDRLLRLQSNVKANNIAAVKAIIEKNPELINQEVYDAEFGQMTPVLYCGNKLEMFELLKSHGADIRAQNNKLLYFAAGSGSMEVVERLVEKEGFMVTQEAIDSAKGHGFTNIAMYLQLKQHEQNISHPDMPLLM